MKKAIVAKKVGMTQIFGESGEVIPVTVLLAGPCVVAQKKTVENDGYEAIQVGFGEVKLRRQKDKTGKEVTVRPNKPTMGHFAKAGIEPKKFLKEFRLDDISSYNVGDTIKATVFANGDKVDISGISKGKGYQGAIKRHGQHRGPMSHGSKYHRGLGAMSGATDPGKVKKGKHMPGHMGHVKVTTQNLTIIRVDEDRNLILVKGAVPGPKGAVLTVVDTVKKTSK